MNIFKMARLLWKKEMQLRKEVLVEKHSSRAYYKTLAKAVEMCKQHPRKYYIVKKSISEWEILGSQEIRKMRKFKESKRDENFMKLHETAPYVSPENRERREHELHRRKYKWFYMMTGQWYKPVTEEEHMMLRDVLFNVQHGYDATGLQQFILKHKNIG